jgi:hypothetical protein
MITPSSLLTQTSRGLPWNLKAGCLCSCSSQVGQLAAFAPGLSRSSSGWIMNHSSGLRVGYEQYESVCMISPAKGVERIGVPCQPPHALSPELDEPNVAGRRTVEEGLNSWRNASHLLCAPCPRSSICSSTRTRLNCSRSRDAGRI